MTKIDELKDKRAGLIAKQREILDKAYLEKRDVLNADEETSYQKIEVDVKACESAIQREQELWKRECELVSKEPFNPGRTEPSLPAKVKQVLDKVDSNIHPIVRAHTRATQIEIEKRVKGGSDRQLSAEEEAIGRTTSCS